MSDVVDDHVVGLALWIGLAVGYGASVRALFRQSREADEPLRMPSIEIVEPAHPGRAAARRSTAA